jgi:hypothetical protein
VKPFSLDTLSTQVEEIIRGDQEKTVGRRDEVASSDDARD